MGWTSPVYMSHLLATTGRHSLPTGVGLAQGVRSTCCRVLWRGATQGLGELEVSDGPEEPPSDGSRRQAVTATVHLHRKCGPLSALRSSNGGRAACASPHFCPNISEPSLPPQDSRLLPCVCFWKSCSCRSHFRLKALLAGTRFGLILLKMPRLAGGGCLQHRDCVRLECWPQLPRALGRSGVADGHCTERPASP